MLIPHHERFAGALGGGDHLVGLRDGRGDGLLQKHMASRLEAIHCDRVMQVVGYQHECAIDLFKTLAVIRQTPGSRLKRDRLRALAYGIRHPNDARAIAQTLQPRYVKGCHPPAPDQAYPVAFRFQLHNLSRISRF
jgi:hypothetical protein